MCFDLLFNRKYILPDTLKQIPDTVKFPKTHTMNTSGILNFKIKQEQNHSALKLYWLILPSEQLLPQQSPLPSFRFLRRPHTLYMKQQPHLFQSVRQHRKHTVLQSFQSP